MRNYEQEMLHSVARQGFVFIQNPHPDGNASIASALGRGRVDSICRLEVLVEEADDFRP